LFRNEEIKPLSRLEKTIFLISRQLCRYVFLRPILSGAPGKSKTSDRLSGCFKDNLMALYQLQVLLAVGRDVSVLREVI
jgi:hypothetical protein